MKEKIASLKNPKVLFIIGILILFGVAVYFFGFAKADIMSARGCNLGSWHIQSYDANAKTVTISAQFGYVGNGGCLGTYAVTSKDYNGLSINDRVFCESFFGAGSWDNNNHVCLLVNNNWFDDKEVKSVNGNCYYNNEGRSTTTQPYFPTFDGIQVNADWTKPQLRDTISCDGDFVVGYKASAQSTTLPPTKEQQTQTDVPAQTQQGQNLPTQVNQPLSNPSLPLSLWQRVLSFFQNILNWFKK